MNIADRITADRQANPGNYNGHDDDIDVDPPEFITAADLVKFNPQLRKPVIDGILRQGETMNLIAASKTGKSWLVHDLALAVAAGLPFLGRFPVHQGRVLLCDNELHPETLAHRLPKVAEARGIDLTDLGRNFCTRSFRGGLEDFISLSPWFASLAGDGFKVIILDAAYRFWPEGFDENKNADVARIYNRIDESARSSGASIVMVHHATKGNQSEKNVIDVGAGAGSQSRAADCHFVLRPHEQDDCVVAEAVVRSWKPFDPVGLRWTFPVWNVDDTLDPTQLREGRRKKKDTDNGVVTWTPKSFAETYLGTEPQTIDVIEARCGIEGMSGRKCRGLLRQAVAAGVAVTSGGVRNKPLTYSIPVTGVTQ